MDPYLSSSKLLVDELNAALQELALLGFDLVRLMMSQRPELSFQLTHRHQAGYPVLVFGNTKALFPPFLRWLQTQESSSKALPPHPLDRYVEEQFQQVAKKLTIDSQLRFAHEMEPAPLPFQEIAAEAGLAELGPAHLSLRHDTGTWLALRTTWALDIASTAQLELLQSTITQSTPVQASCSACAQPCREALARALAPEKASSEEL
ncbi:MAG: hypothetical protein MK135_15420, partial [Polyangiaceae bacterium]|nr:hypothetical protein [Polyangiaceae bacterium]